jgi:hypothetical protein
MKHYQPFQVLHGVEEVGEVGHIHFAQNSINQMAEMVDYQ